MSSQILLLVPFLFQGVRASTSLEPNASFGSVLQFRMVLDGSEILYRATVPPNGLDESLRVPVGGGASTVSALPYLPAEALPSPDGAYFAYSSASLDLRLASVASETTVELLPAPSFDGFHGSTVRFSQDSSRVAFMDTARLLWTAPVDGSSAPVPVNLALDGAQSDFAFSPDTNHLVFRTVTGMLYRVAAHAGGAPVRLDPAATVTGLAVTPDSTRLRRRRRAAAVPGDRRQSAGPIHG